MRISKKDLNDKLDKISESIQLLSHPWESVAETNRKATILASNVAMKIGGNKNNGIDYSRYNTTTYNMIQDMQLPNYMSWDYWVMINQWVDYWVNRYSNFKHDKKELILTGVRIAIMYGLCGIEKQTYTPYYVINPQTEDNMYVVIPAIYMFNSTAIGVADGNLYISDELKRYTKKLPRDKIVFITWRFNNIGDFVWCMKQLLTDIYLKKIIECNASHLTNKIFYKVKNPDNLPYEIAINSNPFSNVAMIISDEGSDINSTANQIIDRNKSIGEAHIVDLITAYKHHQEYYYNLFGRVITSSKNQTLSSDANLNVSSAELVAEEHDRRIKDALEQLGIHIEVEEVNPNETPQNENADKEGSGKANTDMFNVEQKGE